MRTVPEAASLPANYAPLRGGPNDALAREAEALDDLAWKVLQRHTRRLLGRAAVPVDDLSDGAPAAGVLAGEGRPAAPASTLSPASPTRD